MNIRGTIFWTLDSVRGDLIGKHVRDLERWEIGNGEIDEGRLRSLLAHASATVPFCREYNADDLLNYPVITRAVIQNDYDSFLSITHQKEQLTATHTSGSCGTPMTYLLSREKKLASVQRYFFDRWAGYEVGMSYAFAKSFNHKRRLQLLMQNELVIDPQNMSEQWLAEQVSLMKNVKPQLLVGYTSAIAALAEHALANGYQYSDFWY